LSLIEEVFLMLWRRPCLCDDDAPKAPAACRLFMLLALWRPDFFFEEPSDELPVSKSDLPSSPLPLLLLLLLPLRRPLLPSASTSLIWSLVESDPRRALLRLRLSPEDDPRWVLESEPEPELELEFIWLSESELLLESEYSFHEAL
jgi:hypothetical protein